MVDEELKAFDPYEFEGELTDEEIKRLKIKTYPTEVEAWQNPTQLIFTEGLGEGKVGKEKEGIAYYHPPTAGISGGPISHFIAFPSSMSEESVESLLPHELGHEKFRHSHSMDPVSSVAQEIEAILYAVNYKGAKEFKWSDGDKNYFARVLASLPTEEERRLAVLSATNNLGYEGGVPWPYEFEDGFSLGWIHTDTLEDEDKFEKWILDLDEGKIEKLKRSKGRGRKNK